MTLERWVLEHTNIDTDLYINVLFCFLFIFNYFRVYIRIVMNAIFYIIFIIFKSLKYFTVCL
jgi:hypothetical protein